MGLIIFIKVVIHIMTFL